MRTARITVLVVDDHPLFRRGIKAMLAAHTGLHVVGEAADAPEALRLAAALAPQVILLDNHLPGASGVQTLPGLRECAPQAQVLMLTMSEDEQDLADALRAGARGYLLKTADAEVLVEAIERAARGESSVSPEMTGKLVSAMQAAPVNASSALDRLSPREQEILAQIALGASNKEIARTLGIAETTVKIHVQHILRKLQLDSRVQAAVYASRHSAGLAPLMRGQPP
jgi:two-component system, NarL family, nitrate/nitrite response regulator NarL